MPINFIRLISILSVKLGRSFTDAEINEIKACVDAVEPAIVGHIQHPVPQKQIDAMKMREIVRKINNHKKIEAIKILREATGLYLKEAKDVIDTMSEEIYADIDRRLSDLSALVKINPRFNQVQRETLDDLIKTYRSNNYY